VGRKDVVVRLAAESFAVSRCLQCGKYRDEGQDTGMVSADLGEFVDPVGFQNGA
jgi:hypothetical protein